MAEEKEQELANDQKSMTSAEPKNDELSDADVEQVAGGVHKTGAGQVGVTTLQPAGC